jgi:hypothetical protein
VPLALLGPIFAGEDRIGNGPAPGLMRARNPGSQRIAGRILPMRLIRPNDRYRPTRNVNRIFDGQLLGLVSTEPGASSPACWSGSISVAHLSLMKIPIARPKRTRASILVAPSE